MLTLYVCESFEADAQIERGTANIFDEALTRLCGVAGSNPATPTNISMT